MPILYVLAGFAVLAAVFVVASGAGRGLDPAVSDRPRPWLPKRRSLTADDVERLRFGVGLRGYRMDDVDEALDRLYDELALRDAMLADLGVEVPPPIPPGEARGAADEPLLDEPPIEELPTEERPTEELHTDEQRPATGDGA